MTSYYPIHHTYNFPDRVAPENRDYIVIQTVPGRTNMSREEQTEGWLGTSNHWAAHALGEYPTIEEARQRVAEEYKIDLQRLHRHLVDDPPHSEDSEIERYSHVDLNYETWQANDYCYEEAIKRITAATTDEELQAYAEDMKIAAEVDHVRLEGDVLEVLERIRNEALDEAAERILWL